MGNKLLIVGELTSGDLPLIYPEATGTKVRQFSPSIQTGQRPIYQLYSVPAVNLHWLPTCFDSPSSFTTRTWCSE